MATRSLSVTLLVVLLLSSVLGACSSPAAMQDPTEVLGQGAALTSTAFTANPGLWDAAVLFRTLGAGNVLSFGLHEVILPMAASQGKALLDGLQRAGADASDEPEPLKMRFLGANPATRVVGSGLLAGVVNYYLGSDPARWRTGVSTYESVVYEQLYPGIDLAYTGSRDTLKGTYTVAPGADAGQIRWRYDGVDALQLSGGELLIGEGPLFVERTPVAWQTVSGQQRAVSVGYVLYDGDSVGFTIGDYDPALPLTIDPTLEYSTYAGNEACQGAYHTALDSDDMVYLTGAADTRQPPTGGACADNEYYDMFVTKLNPSLSGASQHIYTTYIGGDDMDLAVGIGVDDAGKAYVGGYTWSDDFPTTGNALQPAFGGGMSDGAVVQLSAAGQRQYVTYLGGSEFEEIFSASVTPQGLIAVTGFTAATDFPVTANAYQAAPASAGQADAFLTVVDPSKSGNASLVYSTYFGGSQSDEGYSVELANDLIYLAGTTKSTDLPLVKATQTTNASPLDSYGDTYVAVFNPSLTGAAQLLFASYLGGSGCNEIPWGVTADASGNMYVAGFTDSADFPVTSVSPAFGGGDQDGFIARFDPSAGTKLYCRYVGGNGMDGLRDIVVDGQGNAHVVGGSGSTNLALVGAIDSTNAGGSLSMAAYLGEGDALVASFDSTGVMIFGTFLGGTGGDLAMGIALDSTGLLHVAGATESTDLVTVNPYHSTNAGGADSFAAQIRGVVATLTPTTTPTATGTTTPTVTPTVTGTTTPEGHRQYVPIVRQR